MTFPDFIKVRLIRLYPMILLGVILGFAAKLVMFHHLPNPDHSRIFIAVICELLLLPYVGLSSPAGDLFQLNSPLWSLMFEVWANIFYAGVVVLRNRGIFWSVTAAAIMIGGGFDIYFAIMNHGLNVGFNFSTFVAGIARIGCAFFIGVVLHHVLTPARLAALPSVPFPVLALLLLATFFPSPVFGWLYDAFAALIIFPCIVALGAKDCTSRNWRKPALFAGAVSYPIYVLHMPTFSHFTHVRHLPGGIQLIAFTMAFVAIIGVSYAALHWYDEPVRRWLSRATRPIPIGFSHTIAPAPKTE